MVRQKFKLRLVVGLLVSVFAVSLGFNVQAANNRAKPQTKTSAKSANKVKSAAKASGKKVASKVSKKAAPIRWPPKASGKTELPRKRASPVFSHAKPPAARAVVMQVSTWRVDRRAIRV